MPYIGGAELNANPTHAHHRYVINFSDYPLQRDNNLKPKWTESSEKTQAQWLRRGIVPSDYPRPVAADWPDLLNIVRSKVYPSRKRQNRKALRERWWHYAEKRPGLYRTIKGLQRVLAISRVGQHAAFTFLPMKVVYAESLIILPFDTYAAFCVLQSRLHEIWARNFGSSMKDDLRYTPSDCFETYPFPTGWSDRSDLESAGMEYYTFRTSLMTERSEGLTKIYNRFHDYYDNDHAIAHLRKFHEQMDRSVLNAYGWTDLSAECKFILEHEIEDHRRKTTRSWRYRWPDDLSHEALGRLIQLSVQRSSASTKHPVPHLAGSVASTAILDRV